MTYLQRRKGILRPYFAHSTAEGADVMSKIRRLIHSVKPMVAIPGGENPEDLDTHGKASPPPSGTSTVRSSSRRQRRVTAEVQRLHGPHH